jgi:hypothetical protein
LDTAANASLFEVLAHISEPSVIHSAEYDPSVSNPLSSIVPETHSTTPSTAVVTKHLLLAVAIEHFPLSSTRVPIPSHSQDMEQGVLANNIWVPFRSQCDWEVAHWAKMQGPTSSAVLELLVIDKVCVLYIYDNFY